MIRYLLALESVLVAHARITWNGFIKGIILDIYNQVPKELLAEDVHLERKTCAVSETRLQGALQMTLTEWLGTTPSRSLNITRIFPLDPWRYDQVIVQSALAGLMSEAECYEAQLACDIFTAVVRGHKLGPCFPGSYCFEGSAQKLHWKQIINSDYPIMGLMAQGLRMDAIDMGPQALAWGGNKCGVFLETPQIPFDPSHFYRSAVEFLEEPNLVGTTCRLATALAVALLLQEATLETSVRDKGILIVVSLLSSLESPNPARQAVVYYLLDRLLHCQSRVTVISTHRTAVDMFVFPYREHVSDRVRFFKDPHCGVHSTKGIDIEAIANDLLLSRPEIVIADIGAAFGQCLLPILKNRRVKALFVEASRVIRELIARSVEALGASDRALIAPFFVSELPEDSLHVADFYIPNGHETAGEILPFQIDSNQFFKAEVATANVRSIPAVLGTVQHIDLLMICPGILCKAVTNARSKGLPIQCAKKLTEGSTSYNFCAFIDCNVTSTDVP